MNKKFPADDLSQLRELYPHLTNQELEEVQDTLDQYVQLVLQIYERIKLDPEAYAQFKRELKKRS